MIWARTLWAETKRLKWAIVASVVPLLLLDVVGLRFDLIGELRWVPILQKLSTVSLALILAHLSWKATFYYLDMGQLQDDFRAGMVDGKVLPSLSIAVFALGVCVLRGLFYLAVILGFSMGL